MRRFWQGMLAGGMVVAGLAWFVAERRWRYRWAMRILRQGRMAARMARRGWNEAERRMSRAGRRLRYAWRALKD